MLNRAKMTTRSSILIPLAAACLSAGSAFAGTYTNPDTVPVLIYNKSYYCSYMDDYHALPASIDISQLYKEFTSPGPVLTFTVDTPDAYASDLSNTFRLQLWWVDPDPEDPVDDDSNYTSDDDDTRYTHQNLDLTEYKGIPEFIVNSVGSPDGSVKATLPGSVFWRVSVDGDENPCIVETGIFSVSDDDTSHIKLCGATWSYPQYHEDDYTTGTVGLYYTIPTDSVTSYTDGESIVFNVVDNTENLTSGVVATLGKVFDEDLDLLKAIATCDDYNFATVREVSSTFSYMPIWNTYTDEEFGLYDQAEKSDLIYVTDITMSDPSGTDPSHGLKFIEDLPYVNDDDETIYPNDDFAAAFDYTFSPEGVLTLKLKDDTVASSDLVGTYKFFFRVYVNDGTNDGTAAPYYRFYIFIYVEEPMYLYLGDATTDSTNDVDYSADTDGTYVWSWFESDLYGWYMAYNFPDNRWVWSYEHGWVYMCNDSMNDDEGVFWYDAPSSYEGGTDDDEVGWIWTRYDYYPYFWSYKDNSWVWYWKDIDDDSDDNDEDTDYVERILDKRLFYSFRQEDFITPSEFGAGL
jgi:hypothetical protein